MDFYNPYLSTKNKRSNQPASSTTSQQSRLIPKCLKFPGSTEIIPVTANVPPTFFYNQAPGCIFRPDGKSMWVQHHEPIDPTTRSLHFHVYDIIETQYSSLQCDFLPFKVQTDIIPCGIVLKLLGRTACGKSVCLNVFGQTLYFYAKVPAHCDLPFVLQQAVNTRFGKPSCAFYTELVNKKLLDGYDPEEYPVYKITLTSFSALQHISDSLLSKGCTLFEANVDAVSRFLIDNDYSTFGWYTCKQAAPRVNHRDSNTDLEFDCSIYDLEFHPEKTEWPPYVIMSFDIECLGTTGFPCATKEGDLVIQISCILWNTDGKTPPRNILLSLGTCSPIPDTEVYEFPSELDLFLSFFSLIRDGIVDFVTGYNIANFDFQYLIDRASKVYNIPVTDFTKVKNGAVFEVKQPLTSGNFMRAVSKVRISGIVSIDMYIVCRDKLSLSDYKLNTVAQVCLNSKKDDVSYKEITPLFRSGPLGRGKVGKYCVQDAVIVLDLLRYFMTHIEISEIAKLAKIPTRRVLTDGQQIRVFSCLLAAAREENYILPVGNRYPDDGYQGATVISPLSGFYNTPVLVVDFASLYPSIIQAHNLCYSTIITADRLKLFPNLKPDDYETFKLSSGTVHFVKPHKNKSLLAKLLNVWLAKRKAIRKELANISDPALKTILDKQQLAIKCTCNSVYGFTGVASGMLPCLKIAETVTFQGRSMLEKSKQFVEGLTPHSLKTTLGLQFIPNPTARFKVIYGDTDSLFINCINYSLDEVNAFMDDLAATITDKLFTPPIKLEAEKTFQCLMLLTKKRYIGILANGKVMMKGVDLVRKTACKFVQERNTIIMNLILKDKEVQEAANILSASPNTFSYEQGIPYGFMKIIDTLNQAYRDLASGQVPVDQLIYSTELSRPITEYKTMNLPHLAVYQKMVARQEEPPQVHDRIQYIFIDCPGVLKSDMVEDPAYVKQHNIKIATELYFDKLVHGTANIIQCLFGNDVKKTVEILYNFVNMPFNLSQ